jgi:hypothetical protein
MRASAASASERESAVAGHARLAHQRIGEDDGGGAVQRIRVEARAERSNRRVQRRAQVVGPPGWPSAATAGGPHGGHPSSSSTRRAPRRSIISAGTMCLRMARYRIRKWDSQHYLGVMLDVTIIELGNAGAAR